MGLDWVICSSDDQLIVKLASTDWDVLHRLKEYLPEAVERLPSVPDLGEPKVMHRVELKEATSQMKSGLRRLLGKTCDHSPPTVLKQANDSHNL